MYRDYIKPSKRRQGLYLEQNKWQIKLPKLGDIISIPIPPVTLEAGSTSSVAPLIAVTLVGCYPKSFHLGDADFRRNDPVSKATGHRMNTKQAEKMTQWCVSGEQIEFRINLQLLLQFV